MFRYLSRLENRMITRPEEIGPSRKHLWVDLVFDEETFRFFYEYKREEYLTEILRAISWYRAYRKELINGGIVNNSIEEVLKRGNLCPYRINWHEWRTFRRSFFKAWSSFMKDFLISSRKQ